MKRTAIALLALTASTAALAAPTAGNFYVSGKLGQSTYHKSVKLNDASADKLYRDGANTSYGLSAGYRFTDYLSVDLGWQKFGDNAYQVSADKTVKHRANSLELTARVNQFVADKLNVYLGAGVAAVQNRYEAGFLQAGDLATKSQVKYNFAPVVAAGAEFYFNPAFALGVEYKADVRSAATYRTEGSAGYVPAVKVTQGDKSYTTNRDKYRPDVHFLQGTLTYVFGQNKPVVAPVVPVAPVVVEEKVQPKLVTRKFEVKTDLLFATNKFDINPTVAKTAFAEALEQYSKAKEASVEVVGHADRTGNAAKNQVLSENRAKAAVDYLVANGVDKNVVTYKGVGSSEPQTDGCYSVKNRTALRACLAPDRRVDVFVTGSYQEEVKK